MPTSSTFSITTIVGFPHSGSTLLGDLLATAPNTVHLGETAVLFRRIAKDEITTCSCGASISTCEVWGPALDAVRRAVDASIPDLARDTALALERSGEWPAHLRDAYGALLRGVADTTGAAHLVDSSNWPRFGELLGELGPDLSHVHLVRDPRAAVFSRLRKGRTRKLSGASTPRIVGSVARDALRWRTWNRQARGAGRLGPGSCLRYEDLCRAPAASVAPVTTAAGLPSVATASTAVELTRPHVVWGNRRAVSGVVEIRLDEKWRTAAPMWMRQLVWGLTYPERRHYGYERDAAD